MDPQTLIAEIQRHNRLAEDAKQRGDNDEADHHLMEAMELAKEAGEVLHGRK